MYWGPSSSACAHRAKYRPASLRKRCSIGVLASSLRKKTWSYRDTASSDHQDISYTLQTPLRVLYPSTFLTDRSHRRIQASLLLHHSGSDWHKGRAESARRACCRQVAGLLSSDCFLETAGSYRVDCSRTGQPKTKRKVGQNRGLFRLGCSP